MTKTKQKPAQKPRTAQINLVIDEAFEADLALIRRAADPIPNKSDAVRLAVRNEAERLRKAGHR